MKNKELILSIIVALLTIILVLIKVPQYENDGIKFKNEYEKLNNKDTGYNKEYLEMNIDKENPMIYVEFDELIDIIKNDTAIIYFGFPECPWCRNAVPVLLDAAKELGIEKIYYYNAVSIRDKKSLDEDGNIIIEEEGTKEYKELVELLYDYLPVYDGLNNDEIKRLYLPTVLFVKNGKVLGLHTSTVESQKDPFTKLNDKQYEELKSIYFDYINKAFEIVCDEAC